MSHALTALAIVAGSLLHATAASAAPAIDREVSLGAGTPGFVAVDHLEGLVYVTDLSLGGVHVLDAVILDGARVGQRAVLGRYGVEVNAVVGHDAALADRSVLGEGATLRDRVQVGMHVDVGADATVGHDGVTGHDVRIGDGAVVGDDVWLQDRVEIGAGAIIGAGALLRHDVVIPPGAVVPADRAHKEHFSIGSFLHSP